MMASDRTVLREYHEGQWAAIPFDKLEDWAERLAAINEEGEELPGYATAVKVEGVVMVEWYYGTETAYPQAVDGAMELTLLEIELAEVQAKIKLNLAQRGFGNGFMDAQQARSKLARAQEKRLSILAALKEGK